MLALGSLVMFATFLGSSNKVMIGNNQLASQNEYYIAALSYGQSVIEEAKTKAFKEGNFIGTDAVAEKITWTDTLTSKGFVSELKFDDVDDYDGYRRRIDSPRAEGYIVISNVSWVDESSPNTSSMTETLYKRMTIKITSPYFPKVEKSGIEYQDTLKLSYVFAK
jgi:hypothetical protein